MIGVLGAGAFGTALAIALAKAGHNICLVARSKVQATAMDRNRCNATYLPDAPFPELIRVTSDVARLSECRAILLAIPLQKLRSALDAVDLPDVPLVACSKGIELATGRGPTAVIHGVFPKHDAAVLTGPSFAVDIASGKPTALTLACKDADTGFQLQAMLTTPALRLYRTSDTLGAELGGALKNVMAIACGAVMGASLGESARAATMTRGFAEMQRIGASFGAMPETMMGLSGFGDLALTCSSPLSRNYRLGLALGQGETFDPTITVEGAATARAMVDVAKDRDLDIPITQMVTELLDGRTSISDAIQQLMTRPLKEE